MHRGIALGVPSVALATMGGMLVEVRRAAHAPLPHFDDNDPSGTYGRVGAERAVRVAVLGDSTVTAPGLASGSHSWIARLCDRLPWEVHLRSHARGGSRVAHVLDEQASEAASERPDLFVVAVGANDVLHLTPAGRFTRQLHELLDGLSEVAPVVTLGIGDLSVIPRVPWSLKPAVARRSAAMDRLHAGVAAGREAVVRVPVAELADPHFRVGGPSLFVEDRFHPGARGHALWGQLFEPYVHAALAAHDSAAIR